MRIFSGTDMENPGDCSPSLRVVSKMRTMSMALSHSTHFTLKPQADQIYNTCEFYKVELYQLVPNCKEGGRPGTVTLASRGCRKSTLSCHSERSEESLWVLISTE